MGDVAHIAKTQMVNTIANDNGLLRKSMLRQLRKFRQGLEEPDDHIFYTYEVVFIPDLTQKYVMEIEGGTGEIRAALNIINDSRFSTASGRGSWCPGRCWCFTYARSSRSTWWRACCSSVEEANETLAWATALSQRAATYSVS